MWRGLALVCLLIWLPSLANGQMRTDAAVGGTCAATFYSAVALSTQTLTVAGGQDTVDVGADVDWVEQTDITSEFTKCTGLEDDAVVKLTRSSATAVPFVFTYSHAGRWTGGVGGTGNLYIKLYKHTQAALTGGDELADGTLLGALTRSYANTTTEEVLSHTHTVYSRLVFQPDSIQILAEWDENDCIGVTMGTTATTQTYLHLNHALTLSETGTCGDE